MNAPFRLVPSKTNGQRFLALWFPRLATDRIWRKRLGRSWNSRLPADAPALAISRRENNTQRIAALDARAERLKLRPGTSVAEARALYPDLDIMEEDVAADACLLEALADWCDRYTPLVALDQPDGLFLDITGCGHLFGGEEALMRDAVQALCRQGFEMRAGLASTPGTAYALARFSSGSAVPAGEEADALAPFPLASLRLEPAVRHGLESVGLRAAGAVMAAPRAPLARRFGREVLLRIDQALGAVEEVISPRRPVPSLSAERRFFDPIGLIEDIERMVFLLSSRLVPALEQRGEGACKLELALFRVDGAVSRLCIHSARPLRDPALVRLLFHERLAATDRIDPGFGFDMIRLSVLAAQPLAGNQTNLMDEQPDDGRTVALLADRVEARLGYPVIIHPVPVASHLPERAVDYRPGSAGPAADHPGERPRTDSPRPLRLLSRPEPVDVTAGVPDGAPASFRWRRMQHRITRAEGPERIAPEWWCDPDGETRDYFRVEDAEGHRFWLFREGLYGGEKRLADWVAEETSKATGKETAIPAPAGDETERPEQAGAVLADGDGTGPLPTPSHPRWYMHGIFA